MRNFENMHISSLIRITRILAPCSLLFTLALFLMQCTDGQGPGFSFASEHGFTALDAEPKDPKKLHIIQAGPEGRIAESELLREIVVVFNQPMVPLSQLETETRGVMQIEPPIPGKFRWYGSRISAFVPKAKLRPGTRYTVRIPAATRSLSKASLKKDYRFSFSTPPLQLRSISPYKESKIAYNASFTIDFNYPVSVAQARKFIQLTVEGKKHPFRLNHPKKDDIPRYASDANQRNLIVLKPLQKFPRNAKIQIAIKKGLPPIGGNSGLEKNILISYQSFGPLKARLKNKARFSQDTYRIQLIFNNPVDFSKLPQYIQIEPKAPLRETLEGKGRYFYLGAYRLSPETSYTLRLSKGLKDIYGNRLQGQQVFGFRTPRLRKTLYVRASGFRTIEAQMRQAIPATAAAVPKLRADIYKVGIPEIQDYLLEKNYKIKNKILRRHFKSEAVFPTGLTPQQAGPLALDLSPQLTKGKGWLLAAFEADTEDYTGQPRQSHSDVFVQSTDLGLIIKQGPAKSHAYVQSLTPGKPLAGILVTAYDGKRKLATCRTDRLGHCMIFHPKVPRPAHPLYVADNLRGDRTFVTGHHHALYRYAPGGSFDLLAHEARMAGVIEFDRKLYRPGKAMHFKAFLALLRGPKINTKFRSKAEVQIHDSRGKLLYKEHLPIGYEGGLDGTFQIPKKSPTGHYRISISLPAMKKAFKAKYKALSSEQYGYNPIQRYGRFKISETFQVEEFRPVEFSVEIQVQKTARLSKNSVPFTVRGRYLFGAPMPDAEVRYTIQRRKKSLHFENYSSYIFGDQDYRDAEYGWNYVASGNGKLNVAGLFFEKVPLAKSNIPARDLGLPEQRKLASLQDYRITARVQDKSKKTVTHTRTLRADPGRAVFGIQVDSPYKSTKESYKLKLIALSPDGKAIGHVPAKIAVVHNKWKTIQTKGPGGSLQRKNTLVREIVQSKSLSLTAKPVSYSFSPRKTGWYSVIVYGKNDASYSRLSLYAWGGGFAAWDFSDDDSLELLADKPSYKPGETAKVLIQSPFRSAHAIVSLEREGVLWQKSFTLKGNGTPLRIPIRANHAPVVYLSIMLVRPRIKVSAQKEREAARAGNADLGRPQFKIGTVALKVKRTQNRLPLKIRSDRKAYGPGDTVTLYIQTAPRASVALSVADRGVLDLIAYKYKDPTPAFQKAAALGVIVLENRRSLIRQLSHARKGQNPGGKGLEDSRRGKGGFDRDSEDGVRKNFRYTALWKPRLKADFAGKIRLRFRLPDNLTTFRVMAIAASRGRYNAANYEFQVRQPLILQPVIPALIRPGDELKIGGLLINQTGKDAKVEVGLSSSLLLLKGPSKKRLSIAKGASREVLFPVRLNSKSYATKRKAIITALQKSGKIPKEGISGIEVQGLFSARVLNAKGIAQATGISSKDLQDRIRIRFPVRENPPAEAFTITGQVVDGVPQKEAFVLPKHEAILDDLGKLEISVANTALIGLQKAFTFYELNPYFCLEQRASAFILGTSAGPLLARFPKNPVGQAYNFANLKGFFLDRLSDYQNADGGFRLWKNSTRKKSDPYLTAYVLFALQNAREQGFPVAPATTEKAYRYLERFQRNPTGFSARYAISTLALASYVLAREGKARTGTIRFLLAYENGLNLESRLYLLLSIALKRNIKDFRKDPDTKRLMAGLRNSMRFGTRQISFAKTKDFYTGRTFTSKGSTVALAIRAILRLDKNYPQLPQIIRYAVASNSRSVWGDSHSIGNLAYSLAQYHKAFESQKEGPHPLIRLGQNSPLFSEKLPAPTVRPVLQTKELSLYKLYQSFEANRQYPFAFAAKNKSRYYYTASLRYLPRLLDPKPRDEGLEVQREVLRLSLPSGNEKGKNRPERHKVSVLKGQALKRGELYLVRLTVTNPKPAFHFALTDPIPSALSVVHADFATENPIFRRMLNKAQNQTQPWWMQEDVQYDYRDDKVVITSEYLQPGMHEFFYLTRPVVQGRPLAPPARAFLMYEPEVFGRSRAGKYVIE